MATDSVASTRNRAKVVGNRGPFNAGAGRTFNAGSWGVDLHCGRRSTPSACSRVSAMPCRSYGRTAWEIVEGPGVVSPVLDALGRDDSWGFKLRRGIH